MFNGSLQISWYMHIELDNASNIKIPPRRGLSQAVLYYKYSEINRPQDTVYYSLDTFPFFVQKVCCIPWATYFWIDQHRNLWSINRVIRLWSHFKRQAWTLKITVTSKNDEMSAKTCKKCQNQVTWQMKMDGSNFLKF